MLAKPLSSSQLRALGWARTKGSFSIPEMRAAGISPITMNSLYMRKFVTWDFDTRRYTAAPDGVLVDAAPSDAQMLGLMGEFGVSESRPLGQQIDLMVAWARRCMAAWPAGVPACTFPACQAGSCCANPSNAPGVATVDGGQQ